MRLTQDFTDEFGQQFKAGQTGTTGAVLGVTVVVDFDGYVDAREKDAERRDRFGEGFNVVPWLTSVPTEFLAEA